MARPSDQLATAELAMSPDRYMAEIINQQAQWGNPYALQTFRRMVREASQAARKIVWC